MKRLNLLLVILVVTNVMLKAQAFKTLDASEFDKKLTGSKNSIVLDVRTPEEFQEGHLSNALQIDYYSNNFKTQVNKLDKSKPVFVYCKGGGRSASSCDILKNLGFKEVYNLQGGITEWKKAGKSVIK